MRKWLSFFVVALVFLQLQGCAEPSSGTSEEGLAEDPELITENDNSEVPVLPQDQPVLAIVYEKEGELLLSLGFNAPRVLTSGENDGNPLLAPDGSMILFERRLPDGPAGLPRFELWLVNLDGTDVRPLVNIDDLPGEMGQTIGSEETFLLDRLPLQVAWLDDSSKIAFNTHLEGGYGIQTFNDLWVADPFTGSLIQLLPDGQGGSFAFSPDGNSLLIADASSVSMMDADGGNRREMISFPFVNTASEYAFIPKPVWALDSKEGFVAICGPEPFGEEEDLYTAIWRLPLEGAAEELCRKFGFNLRQAMSGEMISPSGLHFAYSDDTFFNGGLIYISNIDCSAEISLGFAYTYGHWSPDGSLLVVGAPGPEIVGLDSELFEIILPDDRETDYYLIKWIDLSTYVGFDMPYYMEQNLLWIGSLDGEPRVVDTGVISFDALLVN